MYLTSQISNESQALSSGSATGLEKIIPRGYNDVLVVCFGETFHKLLTGVEHILLKPPTTLSIQSCRCSYL
jgi:hypothetical protein